MSEQPNLFKQIAPIYWLSDTIGSVLLGLGLFGYFTPGRIGNYELKPYAIDLIVVGIVLMLPMLAAVYRLGRNRQRSREGH